jgi:hypothetical protein
MKSWRDAIQRIHADSIRNRDLVGWRKLVWRQVNGID